MGVGHRPCYNCASACLALMLNCGTGAAPYGRGLLLLRPWVCPLPLLVELFTPGSPKVDLPPPPLSSFRILYLCSRPPIPLRPCDLILLTRLVLGQHLVISSSFSHSMSHMEYE